MTARKTLGAEKKPQNSPDFAVKSLARAWAVSILKVDRHALSCGICARRRRDHRVAVQTGALTDPALEAYQLCRTAKGLYIAERAALAAYIRAGGRLPVPAGRIA